MSATVDPIRKLVVWNFKNAFGGRNLLYFSIDLGKWSYATTDVTSISYGFTPSATLEELDNYSTSIDALTIPLDSRVFAGGQLLALGVREQKIVAISGPYKTAYVVSGDIDIGRSTVTLAKPIVDNGSATVAVASRDLLTETVVKERTPEPFVINACPLVPSVAGKVNVKSEATLAGAFNAT